MTQNEMTKKRQKLSFDTGGIEIMAEIMIMELFLLSQSNDTKKAVMPLQNGGIL